MQKPFMIIAVHVTRSSIKSINPKKRQPPVLSAIRKPSSNNHQDLKIDLKGVDISIHECFIAPESLVEKQGFTPQAALNVGTQIHTSPAQFGKVMAETKPRLAVGYHFFNDFDTTPSVLRDIRMTYDGPLELATDYMVFNITKAEIKVRMAAVEEAVWPQPSTIPLVPPDPKLQRVAMSQKMREGRVVHRDVLEDVYKYINEKFGSNERVP